MKLPALLLLMALAVPVTAVTAEENISANANPAQAEGQDQKTVVLKAIEDYMDFTEYSSSLIWPEQIPEEYWKKIMVIDARDADQYAKDHIPGAINIEWREIIGHRKEIPTDGMVVVYCNSGSLSGQAVFALRLMGWTNVKVLQDGFEGWKAKGGFAANKRASQAAKP